MSTGIPGLDEVTNGGYFLGSTTVVAGISGVGKSVMACMYIAEGARLGERSLMLSLDEQVPQDHSKRGDHRNRSAGPDRPGPRALALRPAAGDGGRSAFPRDRSLVQEFRPTRVVFDSISTYGSNLGTRGRVFRDFFHALIALMKEQQTATVYNHENPEMLGMSSMMGDFAMSSLVDNIILMNWVEIGDAFRLGLTVAKMRANQTTRTTHECEVVNGKGMRVLPRSLPVGSFQVPFSGYQGLISRAPTRRPGPDSSSDSDKPR